MWNYFWLVGFLGHFWYCGAAKVTVVPSLEMQRISPQIHMYEGAREFMYKHEIRNDNAMLAETCDEDKVDCTQLAAIVDLTASVSRLQREMKYNLYTQDDPKRQPGNKCVQNRNCEPTSKEYELRRKRGVPVELHKALSNFTTQISNLDTYRNDIMASLTSINSLLAFNNRPDELTQHLHQVKNLLGLMGRTDEIISSNSMLNLDLNGMLLLNGGYIPKHWLTEEKLKIELDKIRETLPSGYKISTPMHNNTYWYASPVVSKFYYRPGYVMINITVPITRVAFKAYEIYKPIAIPAMAGKFTTCKIDISSDYVIKNPETGDFYSAESSFYKECIQQKHCNVNKFQLYAHPNKECFKDESKCYVVCKNGEPYSLVSYEGEFLTVDVAGNHFGGLDYGNGTVGNRNESFVLGTTRYNLYCGASIKIENALFASSKETPCRYGTGGLEIIHVVPRHIILQLEDEQDTSKFLLVVHNPLDPYQKNFSQLAKDSINEFTSNIKTICWVRLLVALIGFIVFWTLIGCFKLTE